MAFIRRVRTASGATAVQIAEYTSGRRQRIIAHIGSAHTDAEMGILLAQARELIEDRGQGQLDPGLEPVQSRTALISLDTKVVRLVAPAGVHSFEVDLPGTSPASAAGSARSPA